MATYDSRAGSSAAGVMPVSQPTPSGAAVATSNVLNTVNAGMSLFSMSAKNAAAQEKMEAEALKNAQYTTASNAAASYIQEVEQVRATKGGLAAQTFAAQKFAQMQASLTSGEREQFVDNVKKGLGFNPIEKITSADAEAERAKALAQEADKEQATAIYMASVDLNSAESATQAFNAVQNMTPEQVDFIISANKAGDMKVQKEIQQHNLLQERSASADIKRNQAQRVASTVMYSGFDKTVAGFQVRLEQAITSGDVNTIMQVQKEGLVALDKLEAGLMNETIGVLGQLGINDVDSSTLSAQLQPLRNRIQSMRTAFKLTDMQNATQSALKWTMQTAMYKTAREGTEQGKVAAALLSDMVMGTGFGQTFIDKYSNKGIIANALAFNGVEVDNEAAEETKKVESAAMKGSVEALMDLAPDTPNLNVIAADLTQAQISALSTGLKDMSVQGTVANGVLKNWEGAAYGQHPIAIRSKVFEPTLDFFANAKNAAVYKGHLAGSEDTFLAASLEYIKGNVMPALSTAIGTTNNDLGSQFTVEVQNGKFRLTPKVVGEDFSEQSAAGQAGQVATSNRRHVAQAARKTEALYNKIILSYSNLYGIDMNTAMEVFADRYATALGVDLVQLEDTENGN
ncbi:coil containing protein [Vibrio phage 1.293.O._10N.261.52.E1]|nr:coil containing protein [Vibrio phage 1.293.O._10N.261.52.E1]